MMVFQDVVIMFVIVIVAMAATRVFASCLLGVVSFSFRVAEYLTVHETSAECQSAMVY
jgi:hypothetical protein